MKLRCNAALGAAQEKCARSQGKRTKRYFNSARRALAAASLLPVLAMANPVQAGLLQPDNTPLQQFGFATVNAVHTPQQFIEFYDAMKRALGAGAIVRTGLAWDPLRHTMPDFVTWNNEILEPARARGLRMLPGIRTLNLTQGGLRMPTDEQWALGLRHIVRMYGPNGLYQKGGTYDWDGRVKTVAPHPDFAGLTDFELWNEPNAEGDLGGAMTPAKIVNLLKVGSAAMREEASKLGFKINIIGPAIGGIRLDYLMELWMADRNLFSYIDTLSLHFYTRFTPSTCDTTGLSKARCVLSFAELRKFMDSHGGGRVHLAMTEGGMAGDRGTCRGPQVQTEEQQRDRLEANLRWLRSKPELDFDFWITPSPVDGDSTYSYACDSKKYDMTYFDDKQGVIRSDSTMKPWGVRYHELYDLWSPKY
jgi:hypothetical protein